MQKEKEKIKSLSHKAEGLFEVAWEVCNKVGGIYTVLSSKAGQTAAYYPKNYYLIGPYFPERLRGEFREEAPPEKFKKLFLALEEKEGIRCHFGNWLIQGEPEVILIDFQALWPQVNQIKGKLWQDYKIDSWGTGNDFNEPVAWSSAVGMLLEGIVKLFKDKKIVVHFHEWLSGTALLYLKKKQVKVGTVFTTHGTTLGRTLAYHNVDFYPLLETLKPEEEAVKYNVKAKHQLERATAENCDVFTTVSSITALEAEEFLGRRADVILPNGLGAEKFLSFEELIVKHRLQRSRLREFLLFYFFPYYAFDLEETLFYFISGRYEFRGKGIDIFIKALAELNQKLLQTRSKKTIITFLWVPAETTGILPEVVENRDFFQDVKDSLEDVVKETKEKILSTLTEGKEFTEQELFHKDFLFEIKKKLLKLKRKNLLPPLCTHKLVNENDLILKTLQEVGLTNKKTDKVKVIFYPTYLSGHDGLSNLNYQESVEACHLGVFPSFYEPWGYTPLETAATGVAAVTTDAAGFGRFCQELVENKEYPGIFVLERFNKKDEELVRSLSDILFRFAQYSRKERVENKIQARKLAAFAGWQILIQNYIKAHNIVS